VRGSEDGPRPTPAMMPRRRPAIPPAQRAPARSAFKVAVGVPRRGVPGAIMWPDTGVLLALGTDQQLLDRFCSHYRGRVRLTRRVARELRAHSEASLDADAPDQDHDRRSAATMAVRTLLVGERSLPLAEPSEEDLAEIARVADQLRGLADAGGKSHGGEAEIIVLAVREATRCGTEQILLSNDGGASIVADIYGIPARHVGDVLAEFACADPDLAPEMCLTAFQAAVRVSAPPAHCRQETADGFTCTASPSGCAACDGA
jgi:hypothetical protein